MNKEYENTLGSERTVEIEFMFNTLKECDENTKILDVGGIPTDETNFRRVRNLIESNHLNYEDCDFRGGKYRGDFVNFDFGNDKFDLIVFLSSLEHFPQCTEGDMVYREDEDRRGYEKALSLLNDGGKILLTVPFGKHVWQPYHQNYNWNGIKNLTEGSKIVRSYTYRLNNSEENKFSGKWVLTDPNTMEDIIYTDRAYGCGCFLLQKQ